MVPSHLEPLDESYCPIFFVTGVGLHTGSDRVHVDACHMLSGHHVLDFPPINVNYVGTINGSADRSFRFRRATHASYLHYGGIPILLQSKIPITFYEKISPADCPFMLGPVLAEGISIHDVTVEMLHSNVSEVPDVLGSVYFLDPPHTLPERQLLGQTMHHYRRHWNKRRRRYGEISQRIRFSSGLILPMSVKRGEFDIPCAVCLREEIENDEPDSRQSFRATIYAYGAISHIPPHTILRRELTTGRSRHTYQLATDMCVVTGTLSSEISLSRPSP